VYLEQPHTGGAAMCLAAAYRRVCVCAV
jgi:hypothetical protein